MNHIEMKKVSKTDNWNDYEWFIDGIRLSQYISENKCVELSDNVEPFDDLCPAWTKQLDSFGDVRFVWKLLQQDKAILPIYVCPEDLDFSCIVIVVEVVKMEDFVYWDRVGLVRITNYDFGEEKKHGILDTDSYTEKDWEKYGDNIALSEVDSDDWCQWISENWEEETLNELNEYNCREIAFSDCVNLIKRLVRNGSERLNEHKEIYGEVLLHVYGSEEVGNPLYDLLLMKSDSRYIKIYSKAIELMWRYGDESVKNLVDVTLLERLSDDSTVWNTFGKYISEDFKTYINEELIHCNIAMSEVLPII